MIYKYTKCESVIAKIMADSDMSENKLRITDIREWIFEAVEKIGAPMQYIEKESGVGDCPVFELCDYQIPIPDDLVHLTAVAYSHSGHGRWIPARTDNSEFKLTIPGHGCYCHHHHHCDDNCHHHVHIPCEHFAHHNHYDVHYLNTHSHPHHCDHCDIMERPMVSQSLLYTINGVRYLERMIGDNEHREPTFFVKPGWIVLNKKCGFVKLNYKAIATDERGYPLIPDLASYQEAVYWYVMMKLSFPKFLKGKLGGKGVNSSAQVYTYLQQQWNFYRNQAYAEAMMPTESDMRSIKNEWNKLIPEWDDDEVFFKPEGKKQLNYTDYYYGY